MSEDAVSAARQRAEDAWLLAGATIGRESYDIHAEVAKELTDALIAAAEQRGRAEEITNTMELIELRALQLEAALARAEQAEGEAARLREADYECFHGCPSCRKINERNRAIPEANT